MSLRAEYRKIGSTKLWWGLLIPVAVLSALVNVFGGLFTLAIGFGPDDAEQVPLLLVSLAYALTTTALFAAVHGAVATAGEFRHRTVTTTYLTTAGRGTVLVAKMASSAAVGALYAAAASVFGVLAGLIGQGSARFPEPAALLAVIGIGIAVCALWGAIGAALGMLVGNQVGALVGLLIYVLLAEWLLAVLLALSESDAVAQVTAYLPVNAGEAALYDWPARVIIGPIEGAPEVVGTLAGIRDPLPWWGSLLVLGGWTAAVAALGWWAGARRDVT